MEIVDYLLARKKAGGGSDVTIEQLSVTENGTYSEEGKAYSPVVVNVPVPENSYQLKNLPSGTVSAIEDGTDLPMSSLKVGIEPVQDLHGYDHPWAGGAGKNKCNARNPIVLSQAGNIGDQPCAISAGTYTFSWTSSASTAISLTLWNGSTQIGTFASLTVIQGRGNLTFTITENATSLRCYFNAATTVSDIQVESGSTATSYEPYSNICPISGWTAANVTRSGKNLWNTDDIASISVGTAIRNGLYFRKPGQYTVSAQNSGNYLYCRVFNADGTVKITYFVVSLATITNATFTISDGEYFAVYDALEGTINISKTRFNSWLCQVELGSTATTYEPYTGQTTYTIQFTDGDNPLTVYGGTLDVTTGELVVDRAMVDLGDFTWLKTSTASSSYRFYMRELTDIKSPIDVFSPSNLVCSNYKSETFYNIDHNVDGVCVHPNKTICIYDSRYADTSATDFKTAMSGVQLVYELAEPITYHLTPTQVRTLVGNNNIWADTGDVLSGKYFKEL